MMAKYVALLRAVNVGGTGKLPMTELRQLCAEAGLEQAKTYIASGNVVFASKWKEKKIKAELEQRLLERMGKPVEVLVRTEAEIVATLKLNPFAGKPPNQTLVIFLNNPPTSETSDSASNLTGEKLQLGPREIFVYYPDGISNSKMKLPAANTGTARNITTVTKIAELLSN